MPITILFDVQATAAQYDRIIKELEAAGALHPRGRLFHAAQPGKTNWCVVDVWESTELFQEFGKTLLPIFGKLGLPEPTMQIMPTHNMLRPPAR